MPFSATDLASARDTIASFFPNTCTNARSGQTLPCRLQQFSTREFHFEGAPRFLWQPQWKVTLPDGTDVRGWDKLTIGGRVLTVVGLVSSGSYSLSTSAYAQEIALSSVTFQQQRTGTKTSATDAIIFPASSFASLDPEALQFEYAVVWNDAVAFSNTAQPKITLGDFILWSELADGQAKLGRVTRQGTPFPWARAYFVERQ